MPSRAFAARIWLTRYRRERAPRKLAFLGSRIADQMGDRGDTRGTDGALAGRRHMGDLHRRVGCDRLTDWAVAMAAISLLVLGGTPIAAALSPRLQQRAFVLEGGHHWNALLRLMQTALRRDSRDGDAWFYAGTAEQYLGHPLAAQMDLKKAERYAPQALRPMLQTMRAQMQRPPIASHAATGVPPVSSASIQAMTRFVRTHWRTDAVAVLATVQRVAGSYSDSIDFISPSDGQGVILAHSGHTPYLIPVRAPNWGTNPLPARFASLAHAIALARRAGRSGKLERASLWWDSRRAQAGSLVWDLAFGAMSVPARIVADASVPEVVPEHAVNTVRTRSNDKRILKGSGMSVQQITSILNARHPGQVQTRVVFGAKVARQMHQMEKTLAEAQRTPSVRAQLDTTYRRQLQHKGRAGDVSAEISLAVAYLSLDEMPKAFYWTRLAAEHSNRSAENNLGLFYEQGIGVVKNAGKACLWWQRAATADVAAAQLSLGTRCYGPGVGTRSDPALARYWLRRAEQHGGTVAREARQALDRLSSGG